jgi:hypothetical protein
MLVGIADVDVYEGGGLQVNTVISGLVILFHCEPHYRSIWTVKVEI